MVPDHARWMAGGDFRVGGRGIRRGWANVRVRPARRRAPGRRCASSQVFERGTPSADSVAAAEPLPCVLAPAVRPLHCLRRRSVIQVDSPAYPAMPLPPTMLLRHSGPGRNVHARSRLVFLAQAILHPAAQVSAMLLSACALDLAVAVSTRQHVIEQTVARLRARTMQII